MSDLWYCHFATGEWGPATAEQVRELLPQGHLHKQTWVRKASESEWMPLAEAGIFAPEELPDAPPPAAPAAGAEGGEAHAVPNAAPTAAHVSAGAHFAAGAAIAAEQSKAAIAAMGARGQQALQAIELDERTKQARETFNLYKLFWTRILKSDFSVVHATKEEAERLEAATPSVASPLAQDYVSWRRSLLMVSLLVVSIGMVFNAFDIVTQMTSGEAHFIMKFQAFFLFFIQLGAAALCILAARSWSDLPRSRSLARFAWLAQFALPFLLFMVPLSVFVSDEMILAQIGLGALLTLAPKIFGLFPGVIRCSLTMKTLLPETSVAGWLGIIVAPLYAMLLLVAAIIALQVSEIVLGAGLAMIAVGMSVVILRAHTLLAPGDQEQASVAVRGIKRRQATFQLVGIGLIAFFLVRNAEIELAWFNSVLLFVFSFIANVTLLTVVMSDFMLAMVYKGHQQSSAFAGTEMAASLSTRLDDLSSCGLTDLEAGEAEFASNVRTHGGAFAKLAAAHGSVLAKQASSHGGRLLRKAKGGATAADTPLPPEAPPPQE